MWEQVQLLGVAGAWVWASAAECGRALPLPVGMSMCQAPGVADVLVATAPQRRLARCWPSWASGWGAWDERAAALQRRCPWRTGERGASWAWGDPAPHRTLGMHSQDIRTELIAPPQGPAFSDSQGQRGQGCTERTDLALSVPSMVVAELGPQPSGLPAHMTPCPAQGLANGGQSWRCLWF